jgi:outer membrane protein
LEYYTISKSWTEINKYIMEYGKENKFDMIHGVSGEGNLMYADEKLNVTDQVIEYMNNKYDGE